MYFSSVRHFQTAHVLILRSLENLPMLSTALTTRPTTNNDAPLIKNIRETSL